MRRVPEEGIPSGYNITDADIHGLLPHGETISSQIEAGRLFMMENAIMDGVPCGIHPVTKVWTICNHVMFLLLINLFRKLNTLAVDFY